MRVLAFVSAGKNEEGSLPVLALKNAGIPVTTACCDQGKDKMERRALVDQALEPFREGDLLFVQNDTAELPYLMRQAYKKDLTILFNPRPFDEALRKCDMGLVSLFLLNEDEGYQLTGDRDPEGMLRNAGFLYPHADVVLTLGKKGAVYGSKQKHLKVWQKGYEENRKTTSADQRAEEIFMGYFTAGFAEGLGVEETLQLAFQAGTMARLQEFADRVPARDEVEVFEG